MISAAVWIPRKVAMSYPAPPRNTPIHLAMAEDGVALCDAPLLWGVPRTDDARRATCPACLTYYHGTPPPAQPTQPHVPVHLANDEDGIGLCDAPLPPGTPRTDDVDNATCPACLSFYHGGQIPAPKPPRTPQLGTPAVGKSTVVAVGVGAVVVLGAAVWLGFAVFGSSVPVTAIVVDCSHTLLYQDPQSNVLTPARVAEIQLDNSDSSAQTVNVTIGGKQAAYQGSPNITVPAEGVRTIDFPMNPQTFGSSMGACESLSPVVSAAP
jgi:hypothetical protein